MENASKALLIAAAVLVVILIITIGIRIFNSTNDAQKTGIDAGRTISDKTGEVTDLATVEMAENLPITEESIKSNISYAYRSYKNSGSIGSASEYIENSLKKSFKENIIKVSENGTKIIVSTKINDINKKYELDKNNKNFEVTEYQPINYLGKTKNTIQLGDDILIGETERFKVFSKTQTEIKAMSYYNLVLNANPIKQATAETADSAGTSSFSSKAYWTKGDDAIDMSNPANNIQQYITRYKMTLENIGVDNIQVRVPKFSELNVVGVTSKMKDPGQIGEFWLGSGNGAGVDRLWWVGNRGNSFSNYYYYRSIGVRPIIIIY